MFEDSIFPSRSEKVLILFLNVVCRGPSQLHNAPIVDERIPSYSQDFLCRLLEKTQGNWMERTRLKLRRVVCLSLLLEPSWRLLFLRYPTCCVYSACFAVILANDPLRLTTTASECFLWSVTKLHC